MICHKNWSLLSFCLLKGDKKTFSLVQKIFSTNKNVFLSPFDKNPKEVTSFCDKSRHLFLWQTNRTRLTVGGSSKANNVKFKITFTSADQAVQKKIFQAPSDISWPYLQEKLQSMFSLQRSKTCAIFYSQAESFYNVNYGSSIITSKRFFDELFDIIIDNP